jgi:2,5-diketo-D-gluconate reductase B
MIRTIQGTSVPAIGYGTWELVGDDAVPGVLTALEVGYRHIDTATVYENEAEVGQALAESGVPRADIFLTTKIWNDMMTPEDIPRSVEQSLERLQTDYVDLILLHWPVNQDLLEQNVEAVATVAGTGMARRFGVSNYTPDHMARALAVSPLFCLQVEHHLYLHQDRLLEICVENDMLFTAYSPLARGELLSDAAVVAIAEERGATPAQVAMRWILDEDPHTSVIPKATARDRIVENLATLDVELTDGDREMLAALDRAKRTVDPEWAPDWAR